MNDKKLFGWQHIQFQLPLPLDLVEENGHEKKGFARLADLEKVKIEIRWEVPKFKGSLLELITEHLKKIQWADQNIHRMNETGTAYSVEQHGNGTNQHILFFRANPKNRLIIIRFLLDPKENGAPYVKTVLNSLQDQLSMKDSFWGIYEFAFSLPSKYHKIKANIMAGSKKIFFAKRSKTLTVYSITMASHISKKTGHLHSDLNEWIFQFLKDELKREVLLKPADYINEGKVKTRITLLGKLLLKNLFHFSHHWMIYAKYHAQTDTLRLAVLNYFNEKELQRFPDLEALVS